MVKLVVALLLFITAQSTAVGSNSLATGPGVQGAPLLGTQTTFTITTRDESNTPLTTGGANVQVSILGPTDTVVATVTDNNDGTYTVAYTPEWAGSYFVNVQVEDTPVTGSPFSLDIESTCPPPACDAPAGCSYGIPTYDAAGCQTDCGTLDCQHSQEGNPCGTILGITCDTNLVCKYEGGSTTPPPDTADVGGICYTADEHALGEECNATAFECAPWLTCITPPGEVTTFCEECPAAKCIPAPDTCPDGTTKSTPIDQTTGCPQCECCVDATGACLISCGDFLPCPSDMICDSTTGGGVCISNPAPPTCKAGNRLCPDGSEVQRDPNNNCTFPKCPIVCKPNGKPCPKGLRCDPTCKRKNRLVSVCKPAGILTRPPPYPQCFPAKLNQACGGKTDTQCADGLECVGSTNKKAGKCKKALAQKGEHCGGNIANAKQCAAGLTCVLGALPDAGGTCQALAKKGQHCGGNIANAKQCAAGLTCVLGALPDAGGTCQALAKKGQHCGGNIANAKQCAAGLVCVLGPIPDAGGTCQAVAKKGQHCGGNIANAKQCAAGLTCVLGPIPDAGGTCQALAKEGQHCGGNIANAKQCAAGLVCVLGALPDAGGTCQAFAKKGQHCGGNIANAKQCAAGLFCKLGALPDAGGTCQACPALPCPFAGAGCKWVNPKLNAQGCPSTCGKRSCLNAQDHIAGVKYESEITFPGGDGAGKDTVESTP